MQGWLVRFIINYRPTALGLVAQAHCDTTFFKETDVKIALVIISRNLVKFLTNK